MKREIRCLLLVGLLLILSGCKTDPLIGRWKVMDMTIGGKSVTGKGFNGTTYQFQKDGIVKSWTPSGDTVEVKYALEGDSLVYVSENGKEAYLVDSLSSYLLKLEVEWEGKPSHIFMRKISE